MTDGSKDKVAIITGGGSGIGQALCEELARRGTRVIAADVNQERAEQVVAAISAVAGQAEAAPLDVTRSEEVQKLIDHTASRSGRLDYMFNNPGIATLGEVRGDLRCLMPLDMETVLKLVGKTGRLVVAEPGWRSYGAAAEIVAGVAENVTLKAPPKRVTWPHGHVPTSAPLEAKFYPTANDVVAACRAVTGR